MKSDRAVPSFSPHPSSFILHTFFQRFGLFADAPDAVAKVRELVLEWAATGKLCHNDSVEWKEGVLGDLIELISGQHLLAHEHNAEGRGIPYLTGPSDFGAKSPIPTRWTDQPKITAEPGDILITVKGSGVGKTNVLVDQPTAISRQLMAIRVAGAVPAFVHVVLKRAAEHFQNAKTGIAIPGIARRDVLGLKVVLPPLAEQKRIVAKVDELMALCDRLEAQQQERETRHAALARASLARFADAPTPANLNFLFHSSFSIQPSDLRKSILTLAVQGKLVPQDPNDGETRTVTMEELVGRRNLKNGLSLSPVDGPADFVCLPLSAMKGSTIDCGFGKPIAIGADRAEPYLIKPRDVFIIRGNGSKERVGIAGMARVCSPNVLFPDLFIRVPLPPAKIQGDYFLIAWNSPVTREMLEGLATTTAGIWKVNQGHIAECKISLPPLAEQRRIVAKVDQLMALVDELETQLAASRATAANLLAALVSELTAA